MLFGESWLPPIPVGTDSWLIFAVVLIALIIVIWLIARLVTRVTEDSDPAETDRQMLTAINELHRKGDLSPEEFRSIKSQLIDRLHEDRKSPVDDREDKEGCADLAESTVDTSAPITIESEDTRVDSVTRTDLSTSTDSSITPDQDKSQDSNEG